MQHPTGNVIAFCLLGGQGSHFVKLSRSPSYSALRDLLLLKLYLCSLLFGV